jgi:putative ABC transport system permease protein
MRAGPELAWLQLIKNKGHFTAAVSGVAFAVALMFTQIGLLDSLMNSSIRLYRHIRADVVMTSWEYRYQQGTVVVPMRRFAEALAVDGVEQCLPVQIGPAELENPITHEGRRILLIGFHLSDDLWTFDDQSPNFHSLNVLGSVIYDSKSRNAYGPLAEMFRAHGPFSIIGSHRPVNIVGLLALGPGFGNDGYMFASDATFNELVSGPSEPMVGMIRFKPGADQVQVLRRLRASLPKDVRITPYEQFLQDEEEYWLHRTPIGVIFSATLLLGIVVGAVVVYQILYSDVTNHLPEYATMKAMGYPDRQLFRLVLIQAVCVSIIGFIPGALLAEGIFFFLRKTTLLPLGMTPARLCEVYALTLAMCAISGAIAMLALRGADPAEIF